VTAEREALAARMNRRLGEAQRRDRVPALSAALAVDGELRWTSTVGAADA